MLNLATTLSFTEAQDQLGVASGSDAASLYLSSVFDTAVTNVTYTGSDDAGFLVKDFEIAGAGIDFEGGLLLSSGGYPGPVNTSDSFTVAHGEPGDADLDVVATAAFGGAGSTQDAAVLEFDIFIDDPDVEGIRFDIVFGSDEYPEFSDSTFVDVAAVWVDQNNDGVFSLDENRALFNGDPSTPLSVIDANLDLNFIDNRGDFDDGEFGDGEFPNDEFPDGEFPDGEFDDGDFPPGDGEQFALSEIAPLDEFQAASNVNAAFPIEWDGFGILSLRPELQQGMNSIKIAIGDTGDSAYDSGLYITNFEFLSGGATGDEIFKVVTGQPGANNLDATEAVEEIRLADEEGTVSGTLTELDGDVITGFDESSELIIEGAFLTADQIEIVIGSAILNIDSDSDGTADSVVTLEGDFEDAIFSIVVTEVGTEIDVTFDVANTVATIAGDTTGSVVESDDDVISTSGALTVTDPDAGEDAFIAAETTNEFGTFSIDAAGQWTFASSAQTIDQLGLGEGVTDVASFAVETVDGTQQTVDVTITGVNDAAVFSGDTSGIVTEDVTSLIDSNDGETEVEALTVSGVLTVSDVDAGEDSLVTAGIGELGADGILFGQYGVLQVSDDGNWTYATDNELDAIQELGEGASLTDIFTVASVDGTTQDITITINGANDAAVISGETTAAVTEDDAELLTAGGTLTVADVDADEATFASSELDL